VLNQLDGEKLPTIEATSSDEVLLGRGQTCSYRLVNPYVSREHALLSYKSGYWLLKDLESRTGTYLNTIRMESGEEVQLQDDDLLQIGPWKFMIHFGSYLEILDKEIVAEIDKTSSKQMDDGVTEVVHIVDGRYETNPELLLLLKSDETANREIGWGIFVDRYGPIICGFARNAGLPSSEADDILQTVLFNFFKVADRFEYDPNKGRFRGYLKRITLNAIRQRYRKPQEKQLDQYGLSSVLDPRDDLEVAFDREWIEHLLVEALTEARPKFEPKTWESFNLYGRRGLSAKQTGERLGMTAEAVRHAKSRVMKTVREIVTRLREEEL